MPALRLDAAFVHLNLGDSQGNAAYTGIDPYFDDLFLMAAERRYLSVERVVSTARADQGGAAAGAAGEPDDGRRGGGSAEWCPLHHRRTGLRSRREIPAALRRGGLDRRGLAAVRADLPVGRRSRISGGRPQLSQRRPDHEHPSRSMRGRLRRVIPGRGRNHGQPDDQHGLGRCAAGAADLLPRHRC